MRNVYYITAVIVFLIAHVGLNERYKSKTMSKYSACLIYIILVFISGFRTGIGDTFFYKHAYSILAENPVFNAGGKYPGFSLLMLLLIKISTNPQILIFVMAAITNLFVVAALYKFSKPFDFAILLYFITMQYYVTMNGVRQSMVAAIMLWAVRYMINGEWVKYFLLVLLLSTFHQSALIFIPLYFLAQQEPFSKSFWLTLSGALLMLIIFRPILGSVANMLESTTYSNYGQDMLTNQETVNTSRVFIMAVPLVLAFLVRDKIKNEWPNSGIFIYMSLLNFIFMLFGTQYLYFYRVCIYFDLFNLVLLPRTIAFFSSKLRLSMCIFLIFFYSVYSWYQISQWNESYNNYLFSFLRNG